MSHVHANEMDPIADKRKSGDYVSALQTLIDATQRAMPSGDIFGAKQLWNEHVFGRECVLLAAGRQGVQKGLPGPSLAKALFRSLPKTVESLRTQWNEPAWELVHIRCGIINCLLGDESRKMIEQCLRESIEAYQTAWGYSACPRVKEMQETAVGPAWLTQLQTLNSGMKDMFEYLGTEVGRLNPAWSFTGETVAYLLRPGLRFDGDRCVTTWALFAETGNAADRLLEGIAGKLTVERMPHGCGAVYSHPSAHGYFRTDAKFSKAIQHAFLAATNVEKIARLFDFRWAIELSDVMHPVMTGPSASLPYAAAILAATRGEEFDLHVASTGQFKNPDEGQFAIAPVGDVLRKASAQSLKDASIAHLLVAHNQEVETVGVVSVATRPSGWRLELTPVKDLTDAYERLAADARTTSTVKQYLHERSARLLEFLCKPYTRPRIYGLKQEQLLNESSEDGEVIELDQLFAGKAKQKRLRLFAESGFGKSTLLVDLEHTVSATRGPIVPIRLGAGLADVPLRSAMPDGLPLLSNGLFAGEVAAVAARLAEALLTKVVPSLGIARPGGAMQTLKDWLARKVAHGEILLLLDAADQTEDELEHVAGFLAACPGCSAVVSGRPETAHTRPRLWSRQASEWRSIYSLGFGYHEWITYFSSTPGDNSDRRLRRAQEIWGDKNWRPLIPPPILAEQIKTLDLSGRLVGSSNRYEIYSLSLSALVVKGLDTLNATRERRQRDEDWTAREVMENLLAPVAWEMLCEELKSGEGRGFTGQVTGEAYANVKLRLPATLPILWQINLATRMTIFDCDGKETRGLAWRHLSFFEYFAGRALASKPEAFISVAEGHARDPAWAWVFWFALSHLQASGKQQRLSLLAECLIGCGNPFLVWEAIEEHGLQLDAELERLCRWLVHRTWDHRHAWKAVNPPPTLTPRAVTLLAILFKREHRDGRCLHAAWELVTAAQNGSSNEAVRSHAAQIAAGFITEFAAIRDNPAAFGHRIAHHLLASFLRYPKNQVDRGVPVWLGSTDGLSPFELMDFDVTNAQYELFDPFQVRTSSADDAPANVSKWQAEMFCCWLGSEYSVPTKEQQKYAALERAHLSRTASILYHDDLKNLTPYGRELASFRVARALPKPAPSSAV